jgi:hypothetical protein
MFQGPTSSKPEPLDKKKANTICNLFFGPAKVQKMKPSDEIIVLDLYLWQKQKTPKSLVQKLKSPHTMVSAKHIKIFLDLWHSYGTRPYVK